MAPIPDNMRSLHAQEELLREKALELISADEHLQRHVEVSERAMDLLHFFITDRLGETDDDRAIQYLGIRVFNDFGAAWKLIASGYFQVAAMVQRDIVETVNLVQFFRMHPDKVSVWRTETEKTRRRLFAPSVIRGELDAAMGMASSKRDAIYAKFSKLAAHPSIEGFEMLKPQGASGAVVGPFMEVGMLRALLEEHARFALMAGMAFNVYLHVESLAARTMAYHMIVGMMDWMERYHGASFSAEDRARTELLLVGS